MIDKMNKMKKTMDKMAVTIDKLDPNANITGRGAANGQRQNPKR